MTMRMMAGPVVTYNQTGGGSASNQTYLNVEYQVLATGDAQSATLSSRHGCRNTWSLFPGDASSSAYRSNI